MTVIEVLKAASGHLQKHSSDSSRLDAEVLLAQALGIRRLDLYLQFDRPLSDDELSLYRGLIRKRAHGDPVAYLVGHKEFMALDFEVTPAVLVPNPDTEVLVQRAVAIARQANGPMRVADVGTGSGCIAIAIAHYAPAVEVWASDVSPEALEVAARNVARHDLVDRVHIACGDLLVPLTGSFDLICANLPYVALGSHLPAEVTAQPQTALYAGDGGTELVLRLLADAPARLNPGGRLLAEVSPEIVSEITDAAARTFSNHIVHRDLGGRERVVETCSSIPTNSEPLA
ncbi:MAG TPA: peptide chain release factor N(5)-glutamine methyltransferase [Candidatus Dormibacteraeota bacterium]